MKTSAARGSLQILWLLSILTISACGGGNGAGNFSGDGATAKLALFAGDMGDSGTADGTSAAARFAFPSGVAVDGAGNVYVADFTNRTVRKITPDGVARVFHPFAASIAQNARRTSAHPRAPWCSSRPVRSSDEQPRTEGRSPAHAKAAQRVRRFG